MMFAPTRLGPGQMGGKNIGDLLNAAGVTWGSFMGGFNLNIKNSNGTTGCNRSSTGLAGTTNDYVPHHSLFELLCLHRKPVNTPVRNQSLKSEITVPANHEYDTEDFFAAVKARQLPGRQFHKGARLSGWPCRLL